jgi:UDPglucose 6-dehydrogenase
MSRIAVIGTGYVGLTTGAYLAHLGHSVVCADVVESKVERLNRGEIPIVEAGLEELVQDGLASGRLSFMLGAAGAVPGADFVFLCLPTPQGADGAADLSFVISAAKEIGPALEPAAVVINKSTVPVGSAMQVTLALGRGDVFVVSNPEFLREGSAVADCLNPDRIVIGGDDDDAVDRVAGLYAKIDAPVVRTDAASAEMIKYAANAFLATKLSFVNAVATVCERVGANVDDVLNGMGHDHRIGFEFLSPGPGWGGSCFPKDTAALVRIAADHGYDFGFLKGAIAANEAQFDHVADKIARVAGGSVDGKTIAVLGLTFKAGTDDRRDSPSIAIVDRLLAAGANVVAYDPAVASHPGVTTTADAYDAARGADVLAILTEWPEFAQLDYAKIRELMAQPCVVDGRNLLDPAAMAEAGFMYEDLGRWTSKAGGGVAPILSGSELGRFGRRAA